MKNLACLQICDPFHAPSQSPVGQTARGPQLAQDFVQVTQTTVLEAAPGRSCRPPLRASIGLAHTVVHDLQTLTTGEAPSSCLSSPQRARPQAVVPAVTALKGVVPPFQNRPPGQQSPLVRAQWVCAKGPVCLGFGLISRLAGQLFSKLACGVPNLYFFEDNISGPVARNKNLRS